MQTTAINMAKFQFQRCQTAWRGGKDCSSRPGLQVWLAPWLREGVAAPHCKANLTGDSHCAPSDQFTRLVWREAPLCRAQSSHVHRSFAEYLHTRVVDEPQGVGTCSK